MAMLQKSEHRKQIKHHLQKSSVFKSGTSFCITIKHSERSSREHGMHSLKCDSQHIDITCKALDC